MRVLDFVGAVCWCASSIPQIREIGVSGHFYLMPDVWWITILLKQNFTFFFLLFIVRVMWKHTLVTHPVNACRDSVSITMPFATPHINVRRVWHILVNFTWPFVSPDATVVPVNVTIRMKGCVAYERHSPEKEKLSSSSISFVVFFHIGCGQREFYELLNTLQQIPSLSHKPYYLWKLSPLFTMTRYFIAKHKSESFWNVLGILLPFLFWRNKCSLLKVGRSVYLMVCKVQGGVHIGR